MEGVDKAAESEFQIAGAKGESKSHDTSEKLGESVTIMGSFTMGKC